MNEMERQALVNLVNYHWVSEEADYCEQIPEDRETHIFRDLETLQALLERTAGCCQVHAKEGNDHE